MKHLNLAFNAATEVADSPHSIRDSRRGVVGRHSRMANSTSEPAA